MPEKIYLRQMQALPLIAKVRMSQQRIREWYNYFEGNVFISFSGGKDSTVLTHVVHEYYPDVPLVFCNTGLEYPEIQSFARKMGAEFIRPKMRFDEVVSTYGYPIIGKEVAEAIHYARMIRKNIVGGGTTVHHRTELCGWRKNTLSCSESNCSDSGRNQTANLSARTEKIFIGGGTKAESDGEGQLCPENRSQNSMSDNKPG